MFKAEIKSREIIFKSYKIEEVAEFIINNPSSMYQFYKDYTPCKPHEFFKFFLQETKDYNTYTKLESSINRVIKTTRYVQFER